MSIRDRLQLWLLSALLLTSVVVASATYVFEHYAIRDGENERLKRIALDIPEELKSSDLSRINVKLYHGRDDFDLQIWDADSNLAYRSHADLLMPNFNATGFSIANWRGERWKVYSRTTRTHHIQVTQSLDARARRVNEHALHTIIPPLVVIPLFALFIPLCLNRGLESLKHFSDELGSRAPEALGPLSSRERPKEIAPLHGALDSLLSRLRTSSDMQRTFIADASHELRTPLTTLKVQAQLLERSLGTTGQSEALADLNAGIRRASHLVEQLLSISRLESADAPMQRRPLDLSQVARDALVELSPFARSRAIDLGTDRLDVAWVLADEAEIRLLVRNLIDNAIRYTPRAGRVDVVVVAARDAIELQVEDSGPGIPSADRQRVFDRFYRCLGHDLPGSGLGLAIVKRVADRHGASIELTASTRLGGLHVRVRLACIVQPAGADGVRSADTAGSHDMQVLA